MTNKIYNVLFLCTGNSARSIIAEAIMNRVGRGRFKGFSAGSAPKGEVHPYTLDLLKALNYNTDFAAKEACPVWPGQPMSAHWGVPDPVAAEGNEAERRFAFDDTHRMLESRISVFTSLPISGLDRLALQKRLDDIGKS